MKPFCMCVLSFVCYEGRSHLCPSSSLSVEIKKIIIIKKKLKKGSVRPLTTRRDHRVSDRNRTQIVWDDEEELNTFKCVFVASVFACMFGTLTHFIPRVGKLHALCNSH